MSLPPDEYGWKSAPRKATGESKAEVFAARYAGQASRNNASTANKTIYDHEIG